MSGKFDLVKRYLFEMEIPIVSEDPAEELVIVDNEDNGIKNMVIDCEQKSINGLLKKLVIL